MSHQKLCFSCGSMHLKGLNLKFSHYSTTKKLSTAFIPSNIFQSYDNVLYGGIQSTLLDAVMINLLKEMKIKAVTARIEVRYREIVTTGRAVEVVAKFSKKVNNAYMLESELFQSEFLKTRYRGVLFENNNIN